MFGSYVSLATLFTCFLDFDIPASSFIFIENAFILVYVVSEHVINIETPVTKHGLK